MKVKMKFCILAMLVLTVAAVWFETGEAGAFTISDDGEYALVLNLKVSDADATIDGQQSGKVIKFNFDEDEEAIRVSDLTQGICPYNGKNEFQAGPEIQPVQKPLKCCRKMNFHLREV